MSSHSHVVVGYDFSHSGHAALSRAVTLAARAPVHVLHVVCVVDPKHPVPSIPCYGPVDEMYAARVQEALAVGVEEELLRLDVHARIHFFVHVRIGKAADEILTLAREVSADLIIVGSHEAHGLERLLVGSVSSKIVRDAGCSVEVARPKRYPHVELVPVTDDGEHTPPYVPPHRYTFEDDRLNLRPPEWPL